MSFLMTFAHHLSKTTHRVLWGCCFSSLLLGLSGRICCLGASSVQSWLFRKFISGRWIGLCSVSRASFSWAGLCPQCPCSPSLHLCCVLMVLIHCCLPHQIPDWSPLKNACSEGWALIPSRREIYPVAQLSSVPALHAPTRYGLQFSCSTREVVTLLGRERTFCFFRVSLNPGRGRFNSPVLLSEEAPNSKWWQCSTEDIWSLTFICSACKGIPLTFSFSLPIDCKWHKI